MTTAHPPFPAQDCAALRKFFSRLVRNGGPRPAEYAAVRAGVEELAVARRAGLVSAAEAEGILATGGPETGSGQTMQDFARVKPHGYPGDFQIIDRIYQRWISSDPAVEKWDHFFHAQAAARALCNQKRYFHSWLREAEAKRHVVLPLIHLLHLGGGPGRDVSEYFHDTPDSRATCAFVEMDARAIAYAARLCARMRNRVFFHQANPLNFRTAVAPHLIWAAGVADYLDQANFTALLHRLWRLLLPGGELVFGNFSPANPNRGYLELMGWDLTPRDAVQLAEAARNAGIPEACVRVAQEPERVILFLHLEKPPAHHVNPAA